MSKLGANMHKGYFSSSQPKVDSGFTYIEIPPAARKKARKRPVLS